MRRCLIIFMLLAMGSPALAADPPIEAVRQLLEQKNWPELLKVTTRLLFLRGPAAEGYDRAELWMLKAEAQLGSNQFTPASESFESAAEEKSVSPEIADRAVAMALLARKSDARGYRPPVTKEQPAPEPINIIEPESRKNALAALLNAEFVPIDRDLAKPKKLADLKSLARTADDAVDLRPLEKTATGGDARVSAAVERARQLMVDAVDQWSKEADREVEAIRQSANRVIVRTTPTRRITEKAGLSGKDTQALDRIMKECQRVADAYESLRDAGGGSEAGAFGSIPREVESLYERTKRVRTDAY